MRKPEHYTTAHGEPRWKVRYRSAGKESSETFRREADANTFAALLSSAPGQAGVNEALTWLARKDTSSQAPTFGQWFDNYLAQLSGVTPRTRDDYKAMRRRYLTELDPMPLPLIGRTDVAGIVNRLEAEGKSPKTIKNAIHMLSSVMALAVDEGHIPRNPVKRVRLPKQQLDEDEVRFLSYDEAGALLNAIEEHYQPLVTFLLGTGLRWSEATALQARHINLEAGTVRVQRAWKRVPGGWEIGPPKSQKGNRTVNAGTPALLAVASLLGKPTDYVFTTPSGKVVRHSNFYTRVWQTACLKAGLATTRKPWDGPSPHDLRHTHASFLISDGIGLEAIQDQLGHESLETTRRVYAKLMPAVGVALGKSASAAMTRVLAARTELPHLGVRTLEPVRDADEATDAS
ncbi:tyrosine-type recombinase/integrase [Nocardioides terrigena]|uniref:tyrosine-type recombinase/integrase n=1 Tax=Nocardioides terrigena TaxID=424797 RepID=UPI000D315183|nr:site-specific integrase [Nocardioides terrigena]